MMNYCPKSYFIPKKIVLNIQKTSLEYPIIVFKFNKLYWGTGTVPGDKDVADTMWGIFSGRKELAMFLNGNKEENVIHIQIAIIIGCMVNWNTMEIMKRNTDRFLIILYQLLIWILFKKG